MLLVSNALAALSVYKTSVSPHFSLHLETLSFCLNEPVVKHIIYVIKQMKYKESNAKIAFSYAVAAFSGFFSYHFSGTPPGAQMAESFSKCGLGLFYNVVHLLMELYQRERERERERYLMHSPGAFENLEISLNCLKVKVPQCSIW